MSSIITPGQIPNSKLLQDENSYLKAKIRDVQNTKGIYEACLAGSTAITDLTPEEAAQRALMTAHAFVGLMNTPTEETKADH